MSFRAQQKVIFLFILSIWFCFNPGGTAADVLSLPRKFSVEVFPAMHQANPKAELRQGAVVYHFDGERVSAGWKRTNIWKSNAGRGDVQVVTTTQMKGTFRNGVLKGEQRSETVRIDPPGGYGGEFPGGPISRIFYHGVIEGRLQPDGRIKARVTTTRTGTKSLTYTTGSAGGPGTFQWIDQPAANQKPQVLEYWIPLPAEGWFSSRYIIASGAESFKLRSALERLDRYMADTGEDLLAGRYPLARRRADTIRAEIEDLGRRIRSGKGATRIALRGLPSDDAVIRRQRLQFMLGKWNEAYTIVIEALAQVQDQLNDLRHLLSANVFKSILKNYISWSNSIPTDVVSGIAGYSTVTSLADMPRGVLGWYEESQKDAGILNDQFRKKRALEALEGYYLEKRSYIQEQVREVTDLMKAVDRSPLMDLDRNFQTYFTRLGWASWQADPRRTEILARLQGDAGG